MLGEVSREGDATDGPDRQGVLSSTLPWAEVLSVSTGQPPPVRRIKQRTGVISLAHMPQTRRYKP